MVKELFDKMKLGLFMKRYCIHILFIIQKKKEGKDKIYF